jgi:cephalosporin-C deacetylase-like acetyl esterase
MNRRQFVTRSAMLPAGAAMLQARKREATSDANEPYSKSMPDMLAGYFAQKLNRLAAEWDGKRDRIKTPGDRDARNRFVRQKFTEVIGGFPERTPLEPVKVKVIERPGYRIENVMFQSRPQFWVTGNLYVPTSGSGRFPAIISPCGHYPLARMVPQYQFAYLNLVKNGFVVFAYDPIGQGERRQYWNPETNVTEVGGPTDEHSMPGQLLLLFGESLTEYCIWDGMRAIDYLMTRPEVDSGRIGCAGHSGGGTLTMFISALDERVKCAVIHEGGTRNRWPVHFAPHSQIGPSDVEQNLFPSAIYGLDSTDIHLAIAPRPLLASSEHSTEPFEAAARQIRAGYAQLGAGDKFATVISEDPHSWTYKLRLATSDWFSRAFYGRPGPKSEPDLTSEQPQDLYCTPNGSLRYSHRGETIWTRIAKKQATLPPAIQPPSSREQVEAHCDRMRKGIREALRFRKSDQPLNPRPIATVPRKGYKVEKIEFLSEPGIYISAWVFVPEKRLPDSRTILYFNEAGMERDGLEFEGSEASGLRQGVLARLAQIGHLVVAADVRGIGETRPEHTGGGSGEFRQLFDVDTAFSYMAWNMNESLFGMRVQDVLRTVDYALSRPDGNKQAVSVIGKDMAALWVLYAAALDSRVSAAVCERGLLSYRTLTSTDRYLHGADILILDVLNRFDLPEVAAAVAGRRLVLLSPVDAMKQVVDTAAAEQAYGWAKTVYSKVGAPDQFQTADDAANEDLATRYLKMLGA